MQVASKYIYKARNVLIIGKVVNRKRLNFLSPNCAVHFNLTNLNFRKLYLVQPLITMFN